MLWGQAQNGHGPRSWTDAENLLNVSSLGTINPAEVWQALRKSPQAFKGLVKLAQDPEALKAVLQSVPDLWKVAGDHFEAMQQALAHNLALLGTALFGDTERIALAGAGDFRVFMSKAGEDGSQILRMVGDDGIHSGNLGDRTVQLMNQSLDNLRALVRQGESAESLADRVVNEMGTSIKNNPLRQAYEKAVDELKNEAEILRKQGLSEKEIAQKLSEMRRQLGVQYKDATPELLREYIYEVNLARYQDKLGPMFSWLEKRYEGNYQYQKIIEAASRPNADIDKLLGGFKTWLINQIKP